MRFQAMAQPSEARTDSATNAPAFKPLLCLLSAVVLLSSITPVIKYVFQHSDLHPMGMASLRVMIGFLVLLLSMMLWDRTGVKSVLVADRVKLGLLGLLGVGSY